jgi:hypothetical protein
MAALRFAISPPSRITMSHLPSPARGEGMHVASGIRGIRIGISLAADD